MKQQFHAVLFGVFILILGGCAGTPPTNFYILASLSDLADEKHGAEKALTLGIGPLDFPRYLDRPQIITRDSPNKLALAEFERWAEPLKENFRRVVAENLSILVPAKHIVFFPWKRSIRVDFQISIQVTRLEGSIDGNSVLNARWRILTGNKKEIFSKKSSITVPATGQGYEASVAAVNEALNRFSREIAAEIRRKK
ncbi:MAG: membrane integrity-associated transporter subunit PqiC [Gammaproteobacteria bacterium]|nr:membrane integrity-associated transporter subunit PqiC [Gammaproteobacteria bacterium]